MKKLNELIKKVVQRDDFIFILIVLVYGFINIVAPVFGDDVVLREQYKGLSLLKEKDLILYDYFHWSSRVIVNCAVHLLLRVSQYVWAILHTINIFILLKALSKLFATKNKRKVNMIIGGVFLLYPYCQMSGSGWVTGSVTYFWVVVAGVVALIPIRKVLNGEKFSKIEYIIYSLSLIFAANQEQMAVLIISAYIIFSIYIILIKNKRLYIFIQTLLGIGSMVFIMTAPGNKMRSASEVSNWFKDYGTIGLIDKLEIGFTSTMNEIISKPMDSMPFIVLSIILLFVVAKKYKSLLYSFIAMIPLLSIGGLKVLEKLKINRGYLLQPINKYGIVNVENYTSITAYFKVFIMCLIICSILVSLYLVFENTFKSIFMILMFLMGLATRVAMGFSPTVWASGTRTFIFFYFVIISIIINIYSECLIKGIINEREEIAISSCIISQGVITLSQII